MCNYPCGVTTTVLGLALVGLTCYISFGLIPMIVDTIIESEVALLNDTEQMERFEQVPFPLSFNVRIFNISNPDEMVNGGVPVVKELGPYVYKMIQSRLIDGFEEDTILYRRMDNFEFDPEASYPFTEDDEVTIINVAYHGILQMAENLFPALMIAMSAALNGIFGVNNGPIMTVRVRDLLFDGIPICKNPGLVGGIACMQIRSLAANVRNIEEQDDGSLKFAILKYKDDSPSDDYIAYRGINDPMKLGLIYSYNGSSYLNNWVDSEVDDEVVPSVCNMVNGTDSGIFSPFVNREQSIYALNTDICRSAELRYQYDTTYEGIPVARFSANEWFLDNDEGCFCLNVTQGITRENGCLRRGAMELYSCVGAFLVLTYPHFLYADFEYRNGVVGVNPIEDDHRIFVDLEPNTGTVVRGMKRAQFNIFAKPITSISATQNLRLTLTPLLWVEEGMSLPEEYVNMLKTRLLQRLQMVDIIIPVIITASCLLAAVGVVILIRVRALRKRLPSSSSTERIQSAN